MNKIKLTLMTLILAGIGIGCVGSKQPVVDPNSIYARLGGQPAIDAAVDIFYVKVLADKSVNHFFEGIKIEKLKAKQKQFLAAAFGGLVPYTGRTMRKAHQPLDLTEAHFNAIAGHLQATLKELKIDDKLIAEVMAVAASTQRRCVEQREAGVGRGGFAKLNHRFRR